MRTTNITPQQVILNKANSKVNFTYIVDKDCHYLGRYIVSDECFYLGKNPSIHHYLIVIIGEILKKDVISIGGWLDPDTGDYELNTNKHFHNIEDAIDFAKERKQRFIYDAVSEISIKT